MKLSRPSAKHNNNRITVQPKLELTQPGDQYEQEADRMADFIMRKQFDNAVMPSTTSVLPPVISRNTDNSSGVAIDTATEHGINASRGGGQALPDNLRSQMESGFGTDFSNVRLHTDSQAAQLSQNINAKAFTYGNDIYFNKGQYNPTSNSGQHLIAHELTHVVQQNGKVGREVFIHNGLGKNDQAFLKKQKRELLLKIIKEKEKLRLEGGDIYSLRMMFKRYRELKKQLNINQFTSNEMEMIKKIFGKIGRKTGKNIHFVFAHGAPTSLRYSGQTIEATNIQDFFDKVIPLDSIKKGDTLVLISCQTALGFAQELSKTLPQNIIVAPDSDLYPKYGQGNYFSVGNKGFIKLFLNGVELKAVAFKSLFSSSEDDLIPNLNTAKTFETINNITF